MQIQRLIHKPEIKKACKFLDKYLGQGLHIPENYYFDYMGRTAIFGGFNYGKLVAASSCKVLGHDDLSHIDSYFLDNIKYETTGFLESAAIKPKFRGQGFGKEMVNRRIDFLMSYGVTDIVALCWLSGQERQSLPLLTKMGFTEVEHFIMPWAGEQCPVCGDDCSCNATLVHKKV